MRGVKMNFNEVKRFIYAVKDFDPNMDGNDANTMIYESCSEALEKLSIKQRAIVDLEVQKLQMRVEKKGQTLSYNGALEILASVAHFKRDGEK
jgi:hypothetical protein